MRLVSFIFTSSLVLFAANTQAFTQETHKRIVIDAVNYMKANPSTTQYARLAGAAQRAGYTIDQFAQVLGQGAYDVDDFADTFICGAITGDCQQAPVWGAGASIVKYTSYWHFQNHTRGNDAHGNDIGGYNYSQLTVKGAIDDMAASWLVNDHLDDGPGGMKGSMSWLWGESSKYNSYGITEANYRQGSSSNKNQYADYQNIPWQPIDNLGQYWYSQFWSRPTAQTLGFVLHTTDLLQPHHTWTTSDLNHSGWESWVRDYYDSERLNDQALVKTALNSFTPLNPASSEIRPLLTQGGAYSYSVGGIVLNSTAHNDRVAVGRQVVPHAIAMVVRILDHAATRF